MPNRNDYNDCYTGNEIAAKAQEQGADLRDNGSYNHLRYNNHNIYVPRSDRCLSPRDKNHILSLLAKAGLIVSIVVMAIVALGVI